VGVLWNYGYGDEGDRAALKNKRSKKCNKEKNPNINTINQLFVLIYQLSRLR
jgi:hypothetical protein